MAPFGEDSDLRSSTSHFSPVMSALASRGVPVGSYLLEDVERSVSVRMADACSRDIEDYSRRLLQDLQEFEAFQMAISEIKDYRELDGTTFTKLRDVVIPLLVLEKARKGDGRIVVRVSGPYGSKLANGVAALFRDLLDECFESYAVSVLVDKGGGPVDRYRLSPQQGGSPVDELLHAYSLQAEDGHRPIPDIGSMVLAEGTSGRRPRASVVDLVVVRERLSGMSPSKRRRKLASVKGKVKEGGYVLFAEHHADESHLGDGLQVIDQCYGLYRNS